MRLCVSNNMALSSSGITASTILSPFGLPCHRLLKTPITNNGFVNIGKLIRIPHGKCGAGSVLRNDSSSVQFPFDYDELLDQAKKATELALEDGKKLIEIEFPTSGLESVPGDGEGGIEMTGSMQSIREFCD